MIWTCFIDDERECLDASMIIVRNINEFKNMCFEKNSCPSFISFDHDLGENQPTGFDIVKWIVDRDIETVGNFIPENFSFAVHSQNPIGKANIEGLLDGYLSHRNKTDVYTGQD